MKTDQINVNDIKIETASLIMRPFKESDLNDLHEYSKVPGVGEAAGWKHHESLEETEAVLKRYIEGHRVFALEEKSSGKVIGAVGLEESPAVYSGRGLGENINDIGYVIAQSCWGKGYANEAVQGILSYAFFVLHLDAVTCGYYAENETSRAVIEKNGFEFVAEEESDGRTVRYYALGHLGYGVEYSSNLKKQSAEQPENH